MPKGFVQGSFATKAPIDWDLFKRLCAMQCSYDELCFSLNMTREALEKACFNKHGIGLQGAVETYRQAGLIALRRVQWAKAQKGNPAMLKHLGEHWLGQTSSRDVTVHHENEKRLSEADLERLILDSQPLVRAMNEPETEVVDAILEPQDE